MLLREKKFASEAKIPLFHIFEPSKRSVFCKNSGFGFLAALVLLLGFGYYGPLMRFKQVWINLGDCETSRTTVYSNNKLLYYLYQ